MHQFFIRSTIIIFWVTMIFTSLYWPKWKIFNYDEKSITVFSWGDILEPSVITAFQEETGIKVHLNYYSTNEELIVKLKATRGRGYDLIIPSDYTVKNLADDELLKEIDKSKLNFWSEMNPLLLNHPFDPGNRYSVPFEWEIYGLGIDKTYFKDAPPIPSWKLIFDPELVKYKIAMINDPMEAVLFSSLYLYDSPTSLTKEQFEGVKNLLFTQKKWVEAYADFRADYFLATKNCPVVVASSSYIWRTMRMFKFVNFIIPQEGTFISIENLCLPAASDKEELVYKFINFLYKPESVAKHYHTFGFFPSTLHAIPYMQMDPEGEKLIRSSLEEFKKFHFFQNVYSQQGVRDMWVELKSEAQ